MALLEHEQQCAPPSAQPGTPISAARGKPPPPSPSPAGVLPGKAAALENEGNSGGSSCSGETKKKAATAAAGLAAAGGGGGGGGGGGAAAPQQHKHHRRLLEAYLHHPAGVEHWVGDGEMALLRDLVVVLHRTDPELGHAALAFLPTYRCLETAHALLEATGGRVDGCVAAAVVVVVGVWGGGLLPSAVAYSGALAAPPPHEPAGHRRPTRRTAAGCVCAAQQH